MVVAFPLRDPLVKPTSAKCAPGDYTMRIHSSSSADMSSIRSSVDFAKPGKQVGHLHVPYSYNLGGWANLMVPIAVLNRGEGPTVLVLAGNHGDEYPGQVA